MLENRNELSGSCWAAYEFATGWDQWHPVSSLDGFDAIALPVISPPFYVFRRFVDALSAAALRIFIPRGPYILTMSEVYKATFSKGTRVRVIPAPALKAFARDWKYHHMLQPEQMAYAGATAIVEEVSFYHGGDQLYVLEGVPGIWNEPCIESAAVD